MKKKIAVILSGCGFKDGSEIHESVCTLLAVENAGADYQCFAPSDPQQRVVDHLTGEAAEGQQRLVITESARIARGNIIDICQLTSGEYSALILPGGFGAATNLCDFADKGSDCKIHLEVERVVNEFYAARKPIGFICIAPAIAAKCLGKHKVELTIGEDKDTADKITTMGALHFNKSASEIHIDVGNRVVSTPAYMSANGISEVYVGISKLVNAVIEMT